MTPRRAATFRIDDDILTALQDVKERHGITVSDQVDRALLMWLEAMGRPVVTRKEGTMKLLERLRGVGLVVREAGAVPIGPRPYDLSVWQQVHHLETMGGGSSRVDGLKSVQGSVRLDEDESFSLVGESLILHLEDGRTFPFFLQNSDGAIAARGGIS